MKKFLSCLICFVFLIVGCEACNYNTGTSYPDSDYPKPDIIEYRRGLDNGYYYIVDKNTNTVYIIYTMARQFGITDAVWPDGKPVTVEELVHDFER